MKRKMGHGKTGANTHLYFFYIRKQISTDDRQTPNWLNTS